MSNETRDAARNGAIQEAQATLANNPPQEFDDYTFMFNAGVDWASSRTCVWIPVSERLPEAWSSVLVSWSRSPSERFVDEARLDEAGRWETVRTDGYNEPVYLDVEGTVDAWMPLPEAYNGGKMNKDYTDAVVAETTVKYRRK